MGRSGWAGWLCLLSACGSAVPGGGGPSVDELGARIGQRQSALGIGSSGDDLRTGWYPNQAALSPAAVSAPDFGQLFEVAVDGSVYAQPLLANGALVVVTENNHIYSLDPTNGAAIANRLLELTWNPADVGCGDLVPTIGITGTPVVDTRTNTAYFTTKTYATGSSGPAAIYMHAVDVPTLAERPNFPVLIQGTADNQQGATFNATVQLQRPGLVLLGDTVYATFGGHCDYGVFNGWVVGVSTAGAITAMWAVEDRFNSGGGIWQSGGAPVSDGPDTLIVATGNGIIGNGEDPPQPRPGNAPPLLLGQSWVRLKVGANGKLTATDFWAPYDADKLNVWDADIGSSGPIGLPDTFGTAAHPHLAVGSGKQGYVYLLDRDNLGGIGQGLGGSDAVVQRIGPYGGVWSHPAAWPGSGGWVYLPTASGGTTSEGSTGTLNVFKAGVDGTGVPALSLVGAATDAFGFGSSAPVVTSDGVTPGSALVWVVWSPDGTGAGGQLRGYDAVPESGVLSLRYSAPLGGGGVASKFNPPGVGAGRIYVGTRDGKVVGWGAPVNQPLATSPVNLGMVNLGSSSTAPVTFTAKRTVTVTGLSSTSGDFTFSGVSPSLPARLRTGNTLSATVTFTPSRSGIRAGALVASTNLGPVSTSLSGIGRNPNAVLSNSPNTVSFGGTSVGQTLNGTVTFSNVGGAPLTINGVTPPAAPFSATGLPVAGAVLAPGASVTVTLAFAPTAEGNFTGTLVVATTAGQASVPLSGSAKPPGRMEVDPVTIDFGTLKLGETASRTFRVWNAGGSRVTVTKSKPPASGVGFTATSALPEGQNFNPGDSLTFEVRFSPLVGGPVMDRWLINSNDSVGAVTVTFTGTGDAPLPPPPPVDSGTPDAGPGGQDGGSGGQDAGTHDGGPGAVDPSGGCSSAGGDALFALLGLLPWAVRRRRR